MRKFALVLVVVGAVSCNTMNPKPHMRKYAKNMEKKTLESYTEKNKPKTDEKKVIGNTVE